uniref:Uncharacterized protein n=1 Tax=Glossina pallidipes TaxID=7398 RepID=A0A1B0A3B2_GLOPL
MTSHIYWGESLRNYQLLVDGDDEFVRHADESSMSHVEQYAQYLPLFYDGGDCGISCLLSERRTSQSTYTTTCNKVMGMESIATLRPQTIQSYLLKKCHETFTIKSYKKQKSKKKKKEGGKE